MYDTITLIYSLNHPISFIQLTLDVYCVTLFLMRKIYHVLNLLFTLFLSFKKKIVDGIRIQ